MVELVQETVSIPKESKEVKDCIVDVVTKMKAGVPLVQLVVAELPALEKAVAGFSALPEELKAKEEAVLAGLLAGQLIAALRG